jgi:hypothetical protein
MILAAVTPSICTPVSACGPLIKKKIMKKKRKKRDDLAPHQVAERHQQAQRRPDWLLLR